MSEHARHVSVFGGNVSVHASGPDRDLTICAALLHALHDTFTRFDRRSELCRLNADPRDAVPASKLMCRLAALIPYAGRLSDGLVDATVLDALEAAGYVRSLKGRNYHPQFDPGTPALPAQPDPRGRWRDVWADAETCVVHRPAGVRIDGGGLVKGLAADLLAARLSGHDSYAVVCLGDIRFGGRAGLVRPVDIAHPHGGGPAARLELVSGAVATSGVTARSFAGADGRPAHHLIDPGRGRPAWTGILQATAIAPSAVEAEIRAKTALLSGPEQAAEHLPHGGVLVLTDGEVVELAAGRALTAA